MLSALIGGNSHRSGPNRGMTISIPALFLAGLENEHKEGFPRGGSHNGLMTVTPEQPRLKNYRLRLRLNREIPLSQTRLVRTTS